MTRSKPFPSTPAPPQPSNRIHPTRHAQRRMQQRAIHCLDIEAALNWGYEKRQKGGTYRLSVCQRQVDSAKRVQAEIWHCLGLHVVVTGSGEVITAWWNRRWAQSKTPARQRLLSKQHSGGGYRK